MDRKMARSKILQLFLRDPWGYVKPTKYGFPAISIGLHRLPHLKTSLLQGKNQFLLLVQVGQWGWPKYCIWGPTMGRGPHWTQFGPILVFCLCRSFPVRTGIFVKNGRQRSSLWHWFRIATLLGRGRDLSKLSSQTTFFPLELAYKLCEFSIFG